jgi:hypothetical protein
MIKKILFAIGLCSLLLMTGCSSLPLADGFDEDTIKDTTYRVIELLNQYDYDAVGEMVSEKWRSELNAETMKQYLDPILKSNGKVEEIASTSVYATQDPDTDEFYGSITVQVKHEKKRLTYEVSYNKAMQIVGLYIYQKV